MGKNLFDWEQYLNIDTSGRDDYFEDDDHHPYEPTDYEVLELLLDTPYINNNDKLIDFGSGKGRVAFFLAKQYDIEICGVEFEESMYQKSLTNLKQNQYSNIKFIQCDARNYHISDETIFFFFNPFPIHVLRKVIQNIISAYYENPRKQILIFYYPSSEYMQYLLSIPEISLIDIIDCQEVLNVENAKEVLTIFEIS